MSILCEKLRIEEQKFQLSTQTLRLFGPDVEQYLHSQTTNNVKSLIMNSFQFNSILDINGKIISSFLLCRINQDEFKIIVKDGFLDSTLERIEKFHIAEDFDFEIINEKAILNCNSNIDGVSGTYFFESDTVIFSNELIELSKLENFKVLKIVTGVPELGEEVLPGTLINNTRFDELSIDYAKGCYPGQETVSKINTRRGAAQKPVLIIVEGSNQLTSGPVENSEKKIGTLLLSTIIEDKTYISMSLSRELRIDKASLEFISEGNKYIGKVYYYPFVKPDKDTLAVDLYDHAIERFHSRDDENAISYLYKAIDLKKDFADAYECLGVLFGRIGNFKKAIELMEQLKEIDPKCMMAYTNLSLYHMKLGHIEIAEQYKSEATFLNFQVLGDEAEQKRKEEEILKVKIDERDRREGMFKQVLDMDSEDAMANNGMGEIEFEKKNYESSEKYFSKAIDGNQKYSVAYLGLAKSLYFQNKLEATKEILEIGIKIAGTNGDLMPANEMQALLSKI